MRRSESTQMVPPIQHHADLRSFLIAVRRGDQHKSLSIGRNVVVRDLVCYIRNLLTIENPPSRSSHGLQ